MFVRSVPVAVVATRSSSSARSVCLEGRQRMFARTPAQSGRRQYRSHSVRPYRFTSRAALSASSSAHLDGVDSPPWCYSARLVHVKAARHYPSLPSCVWSNTDARLAECEFVASWQLIDARQMSGIHPPPTLGGLSTIQQPMSRDGQSSQAIAISRMACD